MASYDGKILNGEGLLHLVGTIKAEIENGGGSSGGAGINLDYYLELDGSITSNSNNLTTKLNQFIAENKNFSYAPVILYYDSYYYIRLTFSGYDSITYTPLQDLSPFIGYTFLDRTTYTGKLSQFRTNQIRLITYSKIPGTDSYTWSSAYASREDIQKALSNSSAQDAGKVITINSSGGWELTTPTSGGSSSYTAGDGIEIDENNEISTSEKPPRVIVVSNVSQGNSGYTAEDKEYIINAIENGLDNYPFIIEETNYGVVEKYIPIGRNKTQIKMCGIGARRIVSIGHINTQLAFSQNPLDGTFFLTRLSATNAPSGQANRPIDTELKYIKDNYAKSADVPSYTAGTGIDITNGVISVNLANAESESF